MKTPIDVVDGVITDVDERSGMITIKARYDDWVTLIRREYKNVKVQLIDSRKLSDKQRKSCYALIAEIADFVGEGRDRTKEWMKLKFLCEDLTVTGGELFSLSDAPMSLVCAFQRYLVRFILEWDTPTRFSLLSYVDDISDYVYSCLISKKCCVCASQADLHHVDHVGMGRDREEIVHEGMKVLPLCREHHNECHLAGQQTFEEKYHLPHGIELDKTLCKIYKLKGKKNAESH